MLQTVNLNTVLDSVGGLLASLIPHINIKITSFLPRCYLVESWVIAIQALWLTLTIAITPACREGSGFELVSELRKNPDLPTYFDVWNWPHVN